ncbi:phosphoenolpyruvate synthase [Mesorhizobium amorphae]|uniref:phosphoenolpyruvate synthase n=1 Tax=Mesorhizobium amorphae TaxID=71433 RepID=UPI001185392A|nr:phosphoenolpyruvate synthase [Mesorhizobium amorphae]
MKMTVRLCDVDRNDVPLVGGKAANLGDLAKVDGITVPAGLCVTTRGFSAVIECSPGLTTGMQRFDEAGADIKAQAAEIRALIERAALPPSLVDAISALLRENGDVAAWAVRSSATAEDMTDASFAGQHESFLDRRGIESVLAAIKSCWASLYTERAVTYRQRNRIDHRGVTMAVIVQRMVPADASGVMFTTDPVSGDRTVVAIEAGAGTGEALVSGTVVPQGLKLRGGKIFARTGHDNAILSDDQAQALAVIGRRIEKHFGVPQDIEWCLLNGAFSIVQSRPITTLFPIPQRQDGDRHVYLSVGHQQMMMDAMKPLGLSVWQMLTARPMNEAGGHLFVDITDQLASPASRAALLKMLNRDPLIRSAVEELLARSFVASHSAAQSSASPVEEPPAQAADASPMPDAPDPAIIGALISRSETAAEEARRGLDARSGNALFDFIADDLSALKQQLGDPLSRQALMAGINATWWLNDHIEEWLGDKAIVDTLSLSVDNNITSRMGLDLLDVADVIRLYPAAVSFLRAFEVDASLADLRQVEGGAEALAAIEGFLAHYGMRCAGEIDITRTRWREEPGLLVPMILANIDHFQAGEASRRFDAGLVRAKAAEEDVLQRLKGLAGGAEKAVQTKRAIDVMRTFIGYREYPKYGWVARLDLYRQAMLREAQHMVDDGVLARVDDIYYLRFDELREVVKAQRADLDLIAARRAEFTAQARLVPPRVLTSDGEALFGDFRRDDLDTNMIPGLGVSAGTVEGRARVIFEASTADIEAGDILVTSFTDPSWTPLFLTAAGLVTEAGGQMSHGAVVAREYGIPAIVAVKDATRRIEDGQQIRIDGATGIITVLA